MGCINVQAQMFQDILLDKYYECFPLKIRKFSSDDSPWVTERIKQLDRLRKREFDKNHKSKKWEKLNQEYLEKCSAEKEKYFENMVADLKTSDPSKWHSKLKGCLGRIRIK